MTAVMRPHTRNAFTSVAPSLCRDVSTIVGACEYMSSCSATHLPASHSHDHSAGLATSHVQVSYVLPVSDDGGSTAEVLRVLGGPAIGDIRSRLLRLASPQDSSTEAAVRLLKHRLATDGAAAETQWRSIISGEDPLWLGVEEDFKGIVLSFLRHFDDMVGGWWWMVVRVVVAVVAAVVVGCESVCV
jgi:hypothetical protein